MRKLAVLIYSENEEGLVDAVLEIDRTDENEIALTLRPPAGESTTIYVPRDYTADELQYAVRAAQNEDWPPE